MESGSCSAAHSKAAHQLRVGSGEHSEETARGSGPAEWRCSSWNLARAKPSDPAKQVKNAMGESVSFAFSSRAGTSAGALQGTSRQHKSLHDHCPQQQQARAAKQLFQREHSCLTQPTPSNYRSWQAEILSFNHCPKQILEVALNLNLYHKSQGLKGKISPQG